MALKSFNVQVNCKIKTLEHSMVSFVLVLECLNEIWANFDWFLLLRVKGTKVLILQTILHTSFRSYVGGIGVKKTIAATKVLLTGRRYHTSWPAHVWSIVYKIKSCSHLWTCKTPAGKPVVLYWCRKAVIGDNKINCESWCREIA